MRTLLNLLIPLFSVCLASCTAFPSIKSQANTSQSQFIVNQSNKQIVVFVHGIFGDAFDTWKNSNGKHFYDLVKEDTEVFGKTDIYVYGFPSEYFGGRFNIDQITTRMHSQLKNEGIFNYERVIFVTHSMGGLVTQKLLLKYSEPLKNVPLVFFFGVPQEGSAIANIADKLLDNHALINIIPFDQNEFLSGMDSEWKNKKQEKLITTTISCAYETQPTRGVEIVPWSSATRNCDREGIPLVGNHIDIVKPTSLKSDSYIALRNAVRNAYTKPVSPIEGVSNNTGITINNTIIQAPEPKLITFPPEGPVSNPDGTFFYHYRFEWGGRAPNIWRFSVCNDAILGNLSMFTDPGVAVGSQFLYTEGEKVKCHLLEIRQPFGRYTLSIKTNKITKLVLRQDHH